MSNNLKAGIRFTPDIYAEIGYDSQNETGEMSVIGADGETIWESGESGSGSSDLSIANVTITNTTGQEALNMPFCITDDQTPDIEGYIMPELDFRSVETKTYQIALFKGCCVALAVALTSFESVTGSAISVSPRQIIITGDCSITIAMNGE